MREIKFRLIRDGKIVGYERHVLNNQCGDDRPNVICIEHRKVIEDDWWCIWYNKNYFIDHDYKEQQTGFKDKNSKEIYEGDICRYSSSDFEGEVRYSTTWRCSFSLWSVHNDSIKDLQMTSDLEIIGNSHDNPELMEDE